MPNQLYYALDKPREKPPLKLTKANVARALYCLNKYAKYEAALYAIKDKVLKRLLALEWARVVEYHIAARAGCVHDDEGYRQWTEYFELISFGVFTFHRPILTPPERAAVKDLGAGWRSPREIDKCKPVERQRAVELLTQFLELLS